MAHEVGTYNLETGEVGSNTIIGDIKDSQRVRKFTELRKSTVEFNVRMAELYGGFYFLFYKMIDKGIKRQYIVRFLYLCTFMNYDNNLLFGNSKGEGRFMLDKDLHEVLKLGETEARTTKKVLIDNGLIQINEKHNIYITNKYCLKGKIPNKQKKTCKTRIFEDAIKELYEKAKPKEHKKIGLLIEMLPYINLQFNVVCENPECELMQEIIPMNLTKLAELMGYGNGKTSIQKLKRGLFNITVGGELVIMINETGNGKFVTVNPRTYYKGTRIKAINFLDGLFSIADKL